MVEQHTGFETVGVQITLGTGAQVTRHILIDPARIQLPATNYPSETFEGLFYTLNFDKTTEESAYSEEITYFRWKSGTDIEVVVDWLHDSVDAGVVVWGVEYKSIKAGEAVTGAGTKITKASAGTHTAGQLVRTTFTLKILGSALEAEDILAVRFYRDTADAADTLGEDARMLNVHFHFTMDKLGEAI